MLPRLSLSFFTCQSVDSTHSESAVQIELDTRGSSFLLFFLRLVPTVCTNYHLQHFPLSLSRLVLWSARAEESERGREANTLVCHWSLVVFLSLCISTNGGGKLSHEHFSHSVSQGQRYFTFYLSLYTSSTLTFDASLSQSKVSWIIFPLSLSPSCLMLQVFHLSALSHPLSTRALFLTHIHLQHFSSLTICISLLVKHSRFVHRVLCLAPSATQKLLMQIPQGIPWAVSLSLLLISRSQMASPLLVVLEESSIKFAQSMNHCRLSRGHLCIHSFSPFSSHSSPASSLNANAFSTVSTFSSF